MSISLNNPNTKTTDNRYLRKDKDDTTVGKITIKPTSGTEALVIQKGKRLVLDGE